MTLDAIQPGHGRIVLRNDGTSNILTEMSAMYPLKLLSPQLSSSDVSIVYMLSYGGGLVGGDRVQLSVEVQDGARLAILSQVIGLSRLPHRVLSTRDAAGIHEGLQDSSWP
ncbi:hypothetical protein TRAPUB_13423 [Trametes pubescens]|uniref:Uncharacterized protein n=1 Tax=Trametes pubescens TaxID=154538 RepID=A0A1M2VR52_TRAPU|nr:hypothetical protein TRAPUB_13423 [Trametes pubescens]